MRALRLSQSYRRLRVLLTRFQSFLLFCVRLGALGEGWVGVVGRRGWLYNFFFLALR